VKRKQDSRKTSLLMRMILEPASGTQLRNGSLGSGHFLRTYISYYGYPCSSTPLRLMRWTKSGWFSILLMYFQRSTAKCDSCHVMSMSTLCQMGSLSEVE
jgi:hypothetical protein